ncbi:MAG: hypothetical protein R6V31_12360 [Halohasta sp.]
MIDALFDDRRSAVDDDGALATDRLDVAVYGLDRTGLALSVLCAQAVESVTAADADGSRVTAVRHGRPTAGGPLVASALPDAIEAGRIRSTTDIASAATDARLHLLAVGAGLRADDTPDCSALRSTLRDAAAGIDPGDIVVVIPPVPPGTTEGVVAQTLADGGPSTESVGLAVWALPTERSLRAIRSGDSVVAGTDDRSRRAVSDLAGATTAGTVSTVPTVATAECVDAVERTAEEMLRSLSNELAVAAPEIDAATVAELVSMRVDRPLPGPGVGGSQPVGAGFLRDAVADRTPLADSVYRSTREFPTLIAETALDAADHCPGDEEETTVLLVGVPEAAADDAEAMPLSLLVRELTRAETRPLVCDPVADLPRSLTPHAVSIRAANRLDPDAVVVLADRLVFEELDWERYDATVVDCCGSALDVGENRHRPGRPDSLRTQ